MRMDWSLRIASMTSCGVEMTSALLQRLMLLRNHVVGLTK